MDKGEIQDAFAELHQVQHRVFDGIAECLRLSGKDDLSTDPKKVQQIMYDFISGLRMATGLISLLNHSSAGIRAGAEDCEAKAALSTVIMELHGIIEAAPMLFVCLRREFYEQGYSGFDTSCKEFAEGIGRSCPGANHHKEREE
jgi:hypothetical protein